MDTKEALKKAVRKKDFQSKEYENTMDMFSRKHLCRADSFPPKKQLPALMNLSSDTTMHRTMLVSSTTLTKKLELINDSRLRPSIFAMDGSLVGWTCVPVLANVNVPTLVYNSEFDTSHDVSQVPFLERIPRVRWITFANGGHMCHLEENRQDKVLSTVGQFLKADETNVQ